jgi:predicted RNase H-like HicB family nuclease
MLSYFTAIIEKEDDAYVALCPELDIVSQGETVEASKDNLREAIELFMECASKEEIERRTHGETYVTQLAVSFG